MGWKHHSSCCDLTQCDNHPDFNFNYNSSPYFNKKQSSEHDTDKKSNWVLFLFFNLMFATQLHLCLPHKHKYNRNTIMHNRLLSIGNIHTPHTFLKKYFFLKMSNGQKYYSIFFLLKKWAQTSITAHDCRNFVYSYVIYLKKVKATIANRSTSDTFLLFFFLLFLLFCWAKVQSWLVKQANTEAAGGTWI